MSLLFPTDRDNIVQKFELAKYLQKTKPILDVLNICKTLFNNLMCIVVGYFRHVVVFFLYCQLRAEF